VRPLFASILAHVTSSYAAGLAFVGTGYAVVPEAMALTPTRAWANTVVSSPIVFPTVSAFSLATEGIRGSGSTPHVVSLIAYVTMLPVTYLVFRKVMRRKRNPIQVRATSAVGERVEDGG
jgi:hypothetical protein